MCTLDVVASIPRSVFSDADMEVILWLLHMNSVQDAPTSLYKVKKLQLLVGDACKVEIWHFAGQLGHTYYMVQVHSLISMVWIINAY